MTVLPRVHSNALRMAADRAVLAPSVHNTQPWSLRLFADRLEGTWTARGTCPCSIPTAGSCC